MAHVAKYTRAQCGGLTRHFERAKGRDGEYLRFGNQEIDLSLSQENYNLAPEQNQLEFIRQRCSEVQCLNREDVNVMCSWVITVPKELLASEMWQVDQERFFSAAYEFLRDRYGEKNVVSAHVHMDETTPHMHFAFVPVVEDKKTGREKVSAKEVLTRQELQRFHVDLDVHMTAVFGHDVGILNEATKGGNQTVNALKRLSAIKKEIEIAEAKLKAVNGDLHDMRSKSSNLAVDVRELQAIQDIEKSNLDALRGKISAITTGEMNSHVVSLIQPQKTLTGAVKGEGVTVENIERLKGRAIRCNELEQEARNWNFRKSELEKALREARAQIPTIGQRRTHIENARKAQAFDMLPMEERNRLLPSPTVTEKKHQIRER